MELASYRECITRVQEKWPAFLIKRAQRLRQGELHDVLEPVAERILEDLFTEVLDWPISDVSNQHEHADILLTRNAIKWLVVEAKRPGALAWSRQAVQRALAQALRYAHEQQVRHVAVSDGIMLYAADVISGGSRDRVFIRLDGDQAPAQELWWLSVQGIWRERELQSGERELLPEEDPVRQISVDVDPSSELLHPKYKLPATCFAYVENAGNPNTWKLPYRLVDGSIDTKRLPKAIQAIVTNYRGAQVGGIPKDSIPIVLSVLAEAASQVGKMPSQGGQSAPVYQQLENVLRQFERD